MAAKTEQPTARRLLEARKKGQVPRSRDLSGAIGLLAVAVALVAAGPSLLGTLLGLVSGAIRAAVSSSPPALGPTLDASFSKGLLALAPIVLFPMGAALGATYLQVGAAASFHPVTPKLEHLNPVLGMRRLFSRRSLVELAKSLGKLAVVGMVLWWALAPAARDLAGLVRGTPSSALALASDLTVTVLLRTGLALAAIGVADALYQRWQHRKDLRMTKEEVRREHKETEGDPALKRARERLHREIAEHSLLEEVRRATCVIVNPGHIAVALRYEEGETDAPQVVAKGERLVAARIVEIARQSGVPVLRDVPLARTLFALEVGDEIPEALYESVAEVLRVLAAEEGAHEIP